MKNLDEHPTVKALRSQGKLGGPDAPFCFEKEALYQLVKSCGADDCGFVSIDDPALAEERKHILNCFPKTQTVIALVSRMHRGPVRSPDRSVSNLEFHRVGDEVNEVARRLVRHLEDQGIEAVNPAMAFPMEMERFPDR
ncbi:MAG: 4Fe-4S ferredoxin, partial [Cyanobacteria bacterium]|nr:4Fe-4S ferredoxin [Cyanobacteriota bacterium]